MPAPLAASCLVLSLLAGLLPAAARASVATAVLDAGGTPRRALRLEHRPGRGQRARLSVALEVETALGTGPGAEVRTEYGPDVVVPLRVEPDAVLEGGGARYRLWVGRPEVRAVDEDGEEPAWRLAEELGAVSGREGEVVVSGTGAPVEGRVDLDAEASPALASLVRAALSSQWFLTPQFPEEPVGPGARWAVARPLGPGVLSVLTYELVELRGPRGRVRFRLHARRLGGGRQPVAEGELCFDLRRPLPERLEVLYTSRALLVASRRRLEVVRRTRLRLEAGGLEPVRREAMVAAP